MESRENLRCHWPIAVTASCALHGAIVLGLALLGGGRLNETVVAARFVSLSLVEENNTGAGSFEEPPAPRAGMTPQHREGQSPTEDQGLVAMLVDPWTDFSKHGVLPETSKQDGNNSGGAGHAPGAATNFFSIEAHGQRIVYVMDASASMGINGALAFACRALKESVRKLPAAARFQIIIYNDLPRTLLPGKPGWLEPTGSVLAEVDGALEALAGKTPEGGTDHAPALRLAFLLGPDVVYFLTDADDLTPEHLRLARDRNKGRAVVNTIELTTRHRGLTGMPLQVLARENRGVYQAVDLKR